jgi:hypothetical protein
MSGSNATVNSVRGTSTLVRPRFEPGMLLQHEDLDQLSTYTRELNRLMFRSLFGCGVVCGLVVEVEDSKKNCGKAYIAVGSGLALDSCGDPIYVPRKQRLAIDEDCEKNLESPLWVILCRTSNCCAPRTSICASDDDETTSVCTREREGYQIRVVSKQPSCGCGCDSPEETDPVQTDVNVDSVVVQGEHDCLCVNPELPCYVDHYAGRCGGDCGDGSGGSCGCDCDCVVLAALHRPNEETDWAADHSVRRFIRPVLMRDPQVAKENGPRAPAKKSSVGVAVVKSKKSLKDKKPVP